MTMNKIKLILLSHGNLAEEFKNTINEIMNTEEDVVSISNNGLSLLETMELLESKIDEDNDFLIYTDFPGGSCFMAARKVALKRNNLEVVSGMNLAMLTSFITKNKECFKKYIICLRN